MATVIPVPPQHPVPQPRPVVQPVQVPYDQRQPMPFDPRMDPIQFVHPAAPEALARRGVTLTRREPVPGQRDTRLTWNNITVNPMALGPKEIADQVTRQRDSGLLPQTSYRNLEDGVRRQKVDELIRHLNGTEPDKRTVWALAYLEPKVELHREKKKDVRVTTAIHVILEKRFRPEIEAMMRAQAQQHVHQQPQQQPMGGQQRPEAHQHPQGRNQAEIAVPIQLNKKNSFKKKADPIAVPIQVKLDHKSSFKKEKNSESPKKDKWKKGGKYSKRSDDDDDDVVLIDSDIDSDLSDEDDWASLAETDTTGYGDDDFEQFKPKGSLSRQHSKGKGKGPIYRDHQRESTHYPLAGGLRRRNFTAGATIIPGDNRRNQASYRGKMRPDLHVRTDLRRPVDIDDPRTFPRREPGPATTRSESPIRHNDPSWPPIGEEQPRFADRRNPYQRPGHVSPDIVQSLSSRVAARFEEEQRQQKQRQIENDKLDLESEELQVRRMELNAKKAEILGRRDREERYRDERYSRRETEFDRDGHYRRPSSVKAIVYTDPRALSPSLRGLEYRDDISYLGDDFDRGSRYSGRGYYR